MEFEKNGNERCMLDFLIDRKKKKLENLECIILLESGTLRMNGCTLSLE